MKKNIKPFIKWAGGKTQLLPILIDNFNYNCNKYIEAFVGGGALFLSILDNIENYKIEKIIINDINKKLIILYKTLRDDVNSLILELNKLENYYNSLSLIEEKEILYYKIRKEFNSDENNTLKISRDFIFLNKTCFNGLYRENLMGNYNVPFGKKENINLLDEENLKNISFKLNLEKNGKKIVEIRNVDFLSLIDEIDENTLFYLDPPYRPITKAGFNSYNKSSFNDKEQILLANFCNDINNKGGKFLLSNSDPKNFDENDNFFDDLYSKYNILRVKARRNINSKGTERGEITEILVKNYENDLKSEKKNYFKENILEKNFELFLSQLKETNATLDFFVDFEKVKKNVGAISLKLNQLNYLLGKENLALAIKEIFDENPKAFEILNILIAVRDSKKTKTIVEGNYHSLCDFFDSPEKIYTFIKLTNLEQVFKDKEIKNLVDYVYGIEVGLDTNARKNRNGTNMNNIVSKIFSLNNISYLKEIKSTDFKELETLGEDVKQFDFVVKTKEKTYLIEANFYSAKGSKLNEVARAYTDIAPKINQHKNYEFIWITDGIGWLDSKNKLQEAYNNIPKVYNLTTLKEFINLIKQ